MHSKLKRWAEYLVAAVFLIAALQLFARLLSIEWLLRPIPGLAPMNPLAAIVFMMIAVAFRLKIRNPKSEIRNISATTLALIVLLIGIMRFLFYTFKSDMSVELLIGLTPMSANTAFCFALAGIILLLFKSESPRRIALSQFIAVAIFLISYFRIIVDSYNVEASSGLSVFPMAYFSAFCFMLFSVATLFANPDKGPMKHLTTSYAGSVIARRIIPLVIILHFLYGFLRIHGENAGYFTKEFGTAMAAIAISITSLSIIFYVTMVLNKHDLLNIQLNASLEQKVIDRTEELHRSEQRFRKLLENNYEIISLMDENFIPFYRSPAVSRVTGWTIEESIKSGGVITQTHPDDIANLKKTMQEVLASKGKPVPVSFRGRHKDGHYIWFEGFHTNMLHDESLKGIISNLRDVTKKREAEAEVLRSEQRFRKLLEKNYEAISLSDENFIPFYRSPAAERITGWSTEERRMTGAGRDMMHPDDIDSHKTYLQKVLASRGESLPFAFRTKHKDGHYIWLEGFMTNMLHDESLKGIIGNFRDATARKEAEAALHRSEQRFRKLLENNYESISLIDENLYPIYRSPAADRITGWTTEERQKSGNLMDFTHPDDVNNVRTIMQEIMKSPGKSLPVAFRTLHKDGHYIWLEGFITNMLHDESLKGILGNLRDVTARKEAEAEVQKLTEELRTLLEHIQTSREEERKYIAREIHDELGSALTALKIDISMMHRKVTSKTESHEGYISGELESIISQLDKSINSVKNIATDLRPEILDHLGIIDAVMWKAQQFENMTGTKCTVSALPDVLNLAPAVSATVYRTVQEALTNIARHARASAVKILIEKDINSILIEVKDNGRGISEEDKTSGRSLGLIGMRERVNILNGKLAITGEQGKGTVLTVNIPLTNE